MSPEDLNFEDVYSLLEDAQKLSNLVIGFFEDQIKRNMVVYFWNISHKIDMQKFERVTQLVEVCPIIYSESDKPFLVLFVFFCVSVNSITLGSFE